VKPLSNQYPAITKSITIKAPISVVWQHITIPYLMKKWMLDTDMELDIITDWKVGSPIIMNGKLHGMPFENKGSILQYEPEKVFEYTVLSSISELPDKPENFYHLEFELKLRENDTELILSIVNFATESIYKHLEFYWKVALEVFKKELNEFQEKQIN
jgi:uncharacterized protein YndB with AHSA1/START domain